MSLGDLAHSAVNELDVEDAVSPRRQMVVVDELAVDYDVGQAFVQQ